MKIRKPRYRTFKRGNGLWYANDNHTGKQESLCTRCETEHDLIVQAKNESLFAELLKHYLGMSCS